ncbi:DUF2064 domain-containing protein [uncultured Kriegella sp.]|uniref:TIGR04282 family arsenosugar biosynthesis glycosyltransferase n=1 Tax=uncultured Kriegella sp. TaxID=1798910 RepID=UPI0030D91597
MVFSLSAAQEAERKSLFRHHNKSVSKNFFELLIQQTSGIALESGLDVIWVDNKKQRGSTFGQRYANAFQELFDQGYTNVLSIGNDCPDLTVREIKDSVKKLEQNDFVIGPSKDGGAYLIGIQKHAFVYKQFCSLSWEKDSLYKELLLHVHKNKAAVYCLPMLSDLDKEADIIEFAYRRTRSVLSHFIRFHLRKNQLPNFWQPKNKISFLPNTEHVLRGPPNLLGT